MKWLTTNFETLKRDTSSARFAVNRLREVILNTLEKMNKRLDTRENDAQEKLDEVNEEVVSLTKKLAHYKRQVANLEKNSLKEKKKLIHQVKKQQEMLEV